MSFWMSFWLANIHFAINLFGAMSCLLLAYVLFETWKGEKSGRLILRLFGFILLSVFFFGQSSATYTGLTLPAWLMITKLTGFIFIAISFFIDPTQKVPEAPVAIMAYHFPLLTGVALQIVTLLVLGAGIFKMLIKETKGLERELKRLLVGLILIFISETVSLFGYFVNSDYVLLSKISTDFGFLWNLQNVLLFIAFIFIFFYAWGYLRFRLTSQIIGAFVAVSLLSFIIVTFTYTSFLVKTMQKTALDNLDVNLRTLIYTVEGVKKESLATALVVASNQSIKDALQTEDRAKLNMFARDQLASSELDFLAVINAKGVVLARGDDPDAINETFTSNVSSAALNGREVVDVFSREWIGAPQVLIETAVPVGSAGAIYGGRILDNAYVDGFKAATGLDVSVFGGKVRSATTLTGNGSSSRLTGLVEPNEIVNAKVLGEGQRYLGLTKVNQVEYLSAYQPLTDSTGQVIGMIFTGYPSILLFRGALASLNYTFYISALLALLSFIPAYLLARFIENNQV